MSREDQVAAPDSRECDLCGDRFDSESLIWMVGEDGLDMAVCAKCRVRVALDCDRCE